MGRYTNNSIKSYLGYIKLPETLIQKIQASKYDGLGISNNNNNNINTNLSWGNFRQQYENQGQPTSDQVNSLIQTINNNNSLDNGLIQNQSFGIKSYSTHDGEYMSFGSGIDPEKLGITKDNGWHITTDKYGNNIAYRQKGWMERNGSALFNGLNAAVGLGQLGLGIAQYGTAKKFYNAQSDVLREKLKESKEEYARLKNLRKSIAAKYSK
jgi:hypothetical protein